MITFVDTNLPPLVPVMAQKVTNHLWWIATNDRGRVVGVLVLNDPSVVSTKRNRRTYVDMIYVIPSHRRVGTGSLLLARARLDGYDDFTSGFALSPSGRAALKASGVPIDELTGPYPREQAEADGKGVLRRADALLATLKRAAAE